MLTLRFNQPHCSNRYLLLGLIFSTLFFSTHCFSAGPLVFYVSPGGDDNGNGTQDAPFATLDRARNAIRQSEPDRRANGATVIMRGGRYRWERPFVLDGDDSGRSEAPVVYTSAPNETVILDGGYTLSPKVFKPVTDPDIKKRLIEEVRDHVLEADLRKAGITDYGQFGPRGWGRPQIPAPMELFVDGLPQQIARWPNKGHIPLGKVLDSGSKPRDGEGWGRSAVFHYNTDRAGRWITADNLYISGMFGVAWAHDTIRVSEIDLQAGTLTTDGAHTYGFQQPGQNLFQTHYHVINLLEEIEQPGEYYLDRTKGILYFLPAYPLDASVIQLSSLAEPFIQIRNASHIHIEGITFENSRGMGIQIQAGQDVRIAGCTFRAIGHNGIAISGGRAHRILGCDIYHTGRGGISVSGGDRPTLEPAGHRVSNCDIHSYNRWIQGYNPGIAVSGVGIHLEHNHLHRALHQAITFAGNDHRFGFNEIHHVLKDIADMGSIYVGRNPTFAGNVIEYNFFHHLFDYQTGGPGVQAIFFDDDTIYVAYVFGNIFYKTGTTGVIKFNGGGGAPIANNIALDSPRLVEKVLGEKRGIDRAIQKMHTDQPLQHGFPEMVAEMHIAQPPFRTRYPYLYRTYADRWNPGTPRWNNVEITDDVGDFVDPANLDFQLKDDSSILNRMAHNVIDPVTDRQSEDVPFERIPFEKIGLYQDAHRRHLGPAAFSKLGPADGAVGLKADQVRLWWSPSHNADEYRISVATDADMREGLIEMTTKTNHLTLDPLKAGQTYYWQVEAHITRSRSNRGRLTASENVWHYETAGIKNDDFLGAPTLRDSSLPQQSREAMPCVLVDSIVR